MGVAEGGRNDPNGDVVVLAPGGRRTGARTKKSKPCCGGACHWVSHKGVGANMPKDYM